MKNSRQTIKAKANSNLMMKILNIHLIIKIIKKLKLLYLMEKMEWNNKIIKKEKVS